LKNWQEIRPLPSSILIVVELGRFSKRNFSIMLYPTATIITLDFVSICGFDESSEALGLVRLSLAEILRGLVFLAMQNETGYVLRGRMRESGRWGTLGGEPEP
jgi:hypothetical protein